MELQDLSDVECGWVLNVVQRDFELRDKHDSLAQKDQKSLVQTIESRRQLINKDATFNQKYCIWCYSRFFIFFNPKTKCEVCNYTVCNKCRSFNNQMECYICCVCQKSFDIHSRNLIWFNRKMHSKFLQTGSEVVVAAYRSRMLERESQDVFSADDISDTDLDNDSKSIDSGYDHGGGSNRSEKKSNTDFSDANHGTSGGIWPIREESSDLEPQFYDAYDNLDIDTMVTLNSPTEEPCNNNDITDGKLERVFLERQSANPETLRRNSSTEEMLLPDFKRTPVFMPGIHHVNCKLCSRRHANDSRRLTF